MPFKLLKDDEIYKQERALTSPGTFVDGVQYPPVFTTTYPIFYGEWEPVEEGQKTRILPQGLQSRDAISIMTDEVLKVANDLGGSTFTEGDVVYLDNPATNPDALPYDVWKFEPWKKNRGYKLLDGHNYVVAIRREKQ